MKKVFVGLGIGLLCLSLAFAQSVEPSVLSVAGPQQSAGNVQVSWTVGQTATATLTSPDVTLTQGFQQSQLTVTSLDPLPPTIDMQVFPNPSSNFIQIEWEGLSPQLNFQWVDARGKLLDQWSFSQGGTNQYDVSRYAAGNYLLQVQTETGFVQAFKIQIQH